MSSFATINYNGTNPFAGLAPTPFVGRVENMVQLGERLLSEETFSLKGAITGICTTEPLQFNQMMAMQLQLLNNFGTDFQTLDIINNDGTEVLHRDLVKVQSISFPANNYGSYHIYLPFEISLQAFPGYQGDKYTAAGYYVLNPIHTVQYQESDEGVVQIEVNTSAKGLNTSTSGNNALANAESWVEAFKDWRPPNIDTTFGNLSNACLRTSSENINRYDGSYELKETYVVDELGTGPGILRYTTTYNYDLNEGISTVEIAGTIEGCRGTAGDSTIDDLRSRWKLFDIQAFSNAVIAYQAVTNRVDLNGNVITKSVTEDDSKLKISFNYLFNNDLRPPIWYDFKATIDYDYENDSFTVSIQGDVTDRNILSSYTDNNGLITTNKWTEIENFAKQLNLFSFAQAEFSAWAAANNVPIGSYPLGKLVMSTNRTEDRYNSKLGLGASFKTQPAFLPAGWQKFDYSISCNPSLEQFKEFPCLDGYGKYQVYDLGYATRAQYTIQANGIAPDTGDTTGKAALTAMEGQINVLVAKNAVGGRQNLDSQQIVGGRASFARQVSANATVSAEGVTFEV